MTPTIRNLQVHNDAYLTAEVHDATEIKLENWNRWRSLSEFSWYNPNLVVGSTDKPLGPGNRTLSARNATEQVDVPFVIGKPEPPALAWETVQTLSKVADWPGGKLISGLTGASITDTPQGMRFFIPGPQSGERCEVQTYFGKEGMTCAYEWSFLIPAHVQLSTATDGENLIQ